MTEVTEKVERAIARFERVARHIDERGGPPPTPRAASGSA